MENNVPYVGKPFSIDLATGEILDHGGDLTITIKQPRSEEEFSVAAKAIGPDALPLGVFPWSCEITANSGAIYEVSVDEFDRKVFGVYDRPMIKSRSFTFNGTGNIAELYAVVRCRDDKLKGKLHLRIISGQKANMRKVILQISDGLFNQSGSSSLELDPEQLAKKALRDMRTPEELKDQ